MSEQLSKLPKWAQERIRNLEREREVAVRALRDWSDSQTYSPISIPEYASTGENQGPTRYVRYVEGHRVDIDWLGVRLSVLLRDEVIDLQWSANHAIGDVCMQPRSYQNVWLISKEQMR